MRSRRLVGLMGKKGHGKNALAEAIRERSADRAVELAFAGPLKSAAGMIFHLNTRQLHGDMKEEEDPRWGKTPREIMQLFGTEVGRAIDPDVWIKSARIAVEAVWKRDPKVIVVITDVRFQNEAEFVRGLRGLLVRVHRPSMAMKQLPMFAEHASESEQDDIMHEVRVINNGDLSSLRDAADWLLAVLSQRDHSVLQERGYVCSTRTSSRV